MPRLPIDYSKTIIYKIVCNDLNIIDVYVGSTTDFIRRKNEHKRSCNSEKSERYNLKVYQSIRQNGGWDNFSMVEIEKYPCNDSNESRARERHYFELLNTSLNTRCPIRFDKKECHLLYRQNNKDKVKERSDEYYKNNKDKIKEYTELNKDKIKELQKKYREDNKGKQKQYMKEYHKLKREAKKEFLAIE
jgi:hypothetical protein